MNSTTTNGASLLFLGAEAHRTSARTLGDMRENFSRLDVETSRSILRLYQSRTNAAAAEIRQTNAI
jgi:hypothetical protein